MKTKRWLRQYAAVLLKRYYNFIRFRVGFVWQFIFPLLFLTLGLILAVTIPNIYGNEPKRSLTLPNSAPEESIKLFWGDFSESDLPFDIEDVLSHEFGNPSIENISMKVNSIRSGLKLNDRTEDCCDYEYQILDSFCAQKTQEELMNECSASKDFGYHRCLSRCLSCCASKEHQLASCSNPRFQQINNLYNVPVASNFCPKSPRLSINKQNDSNGPLDGLDIFVDEFLLRKASKDHLFFKLYLGGFTVMDMLPAYTTCQCDDQYPENIKMIDTLNHLISESCYGRTPIFQSYCKENKLFQSILKINASTYTYSNSLLDDFEIGSGIDKLCTDSLIDILGNENCTIGSYCKDNTCSNCNCYNRSLNSWYGEFHPESSASVVIWYNNEHYHVAPAILSVFHNLYLKKVMGDSFSITVFNHPLPRNPVNQASAVEADVIIFAVGMLASFGFSFLIASYALFIVHEKSSKAKHLQIVSGLRKSAYWLANLTWDMLSSLLPVIAAFLLFVIFQFVLPHFSEPITLFAIFSLLLLVCWAEIPLVYLLSLLFENIYTAYTSIFIMTSMVTLMFLSIVYLINVIVDNKNAANALHYIFLLNPSYGLASGLSDIYLNHVVRESCNESPVSLSTCKQEDINFFENPFEIKRPGVGLVVIYLLVEGIIFTILTILIDHVNDILQFLMRKKNWTLKKYHENAKKKNQKVKIISRSARSQSMYGRPKSGLVVTNDGGFTRSMSMRTGLRNSMSRMELEDVSVRVERRNVGNMLRMAQQKELTSDCSLVLSRVSKQYNNGVWSKIRSLWMVEEPTPPAIAEVTLTVKETECFGLAGFNGAGKTTLFKILTGDIHCTTGVATICGFNISTHLNKVQKYLGYCPQFDALIERMTGREILTMFARIKGLTKDSVQEEVNEKLDLLNLNDHADKLCWKYSGGNKRKLSAAIALIGDPKVVLLDEPTTGMDIETRGRFIKMLKTLVERKKTSIILTSHNMGECEAVCNRIGILIKGEFRCIGSTEDLKAKYGEQKTKIVIRVESYTPTPSQSVELNPNPQHLRRTPSMYSRLQSGFGRVLSSVAMGSGPPVQQDVIEEESEDDEDEFYEEDEIDAGVDPAPIIEEEDQTDYYNKYLTEVCEKFEKEFGAFRAVRKIGCDSDEVTYKLPKTLVPLSKIFDVMEKMKNNEERYHILSYSVSQSTLEQVYNFFANEQRQYNK